MLQIWNWFSGKKTIIGAALLLTATLIQQLVVGVNHFDPAWIETLMANLNYLGEFFAGTGLIHKAVAK